MIPNLQHLVFLDVKRLPVYDKNSKLIHFVHFVLKFLGKIVLKI